LAEKSMTETMSGLLKPAVSKDSPFEV